MLCLIALVVAASGFENPQLVQRRVTARPVAADDQSSLVATDAYGRNDVCAGDSLCTFEPVLNFTACEEYTEYSNKAACSKITKSVTLDAFCQGLSETFCGQEAGWFARNLAQSALVPYMGMGYEAGYNVTTVALVGAATLYYGISRPWSYPEFAVGDEIDIKYGGTRYAVTVEEISHQSREWWYTVSYECGNTSCVKASHLDQRRDDPDEEDEDEGPTGFQPPWQDPDEQSQDPWRAPADDDHSHEGLNGPDDDEEDRSFTVWKSTFFSRTGIDPFNTHRSTSKRKLSNDEDEDDGWFGRLFKRNKVTRTWRENAQELLDELEGCASIDGISRATFEAYGFFVYPSIRLFVRPPDHWPSYYELVGKDGGQRPRDQLKMLSKRSLVDYLEKALALEDGFRTEAQVRAVDLGLSRDGTKTEPERSEVVYKLPGGQMSILIPRAGDPEPTDEQLSWEGKIFRMKGIDWFVREVSVVVFADGVTRVACWCYVYDKHGGDGPEYQDYHWCVPCDDLGDVVWDTRRAPRPRRGALQAAEKAEADLLISNRRGRRGGSLGRKFGARTACGDLSRAGRRVVSKGTAPSRAGQGNSGGRDRICPGTNLRVRDCHCGNYPNDPSHGSAIANKLLGSVMQGVGRVANNPARGLGNGWTTFYDIDPRYICPDYTPQEIALILRASMPKPHGRSTLDDVFKRRQADDRHKFSYDHIIPKSVILADYARPSGGKLRPAYDANGRPNVVLRDLCHPYNLQYADKYANCSIKGVARLSDVSKEHEAWYQARLLCFWDGEELKKPFGDRTPRPFDQTIRMLKAEAAKGHCFLGFEKEVHHEFNY